MVCTACTKIPEELLTSLNPAHMHTLRRKLCSGVFDEIRKALEPKARCGILLRCLAFGKYHHMMKDDRSVYTTRHCLITEDQFPVKKWEDLVRVNKDDIKGPYPDNSDKATLKLTGNHEAVDTFHDRGSEREGRENKDSPLKPLLIMKGGILAVRVMIR